MPIPAKYQAEFQEGGVYHVFNRTNNKEQLFRTDGNRHYFLQKYEDYLTPYAETFCWCLLPTHFHLLLRIKRQKGIRSCLEQKTGTLTGTEKSFLSLEIGLGELIERAFKNMFQSYSQAFNKQHSRHGNLFSKPFRRVAVDTNEHFTRTIVYIHANPQRHGIIKDFRQYRWSSYSILLADTPTTLLRDEVMAWFGNKELFGKNHLQLLEETLGMPTFRDANL